jgi:type IV pilus assembly protein PilV
MNKKGFTLIEVLIGLVILAIGLLGIAGMQVSSVKGNFSSSNLTEATYIAKDRLEFLKNLPFSDGQLSTTTHPDGSTNSSTGIVFTRTYAVTQDVSGFKTITYNVTWNEGVAHGVTFTTIRAL